MFHFSVFFKLFFASLCNSYSSFENINKKDSIFFWQFLGSGDDVFRQLNKADDTVKTKIDNLSDEEFILSKIGNDTHDIHLSTALNGSNAKNKYLSWSKVKKLEKKLLMIQTT